MQCNRVISMRTVKAGRTQRTVYLCCASIITCFPILTKKMTKQQVTTFTICANEMSSTRTQCMFELEMHQYNCRDANCNNRHELTSIMATAVELQYIGPALLRLYDMSSTKAVFCNTKSPNEIYLRESMVPSSHAGYKHTL
jgi:hypothetical protein